MLGPGAYRPDPTEGITAIADLPPPELVPYSRNDKRQPCPRCGHSAYRDKQSQRTLHDLGNLDLWCPRDLVVTYSQHYCTRCQKYFNIDLADLAPPGSHYTHRVIDLAVRVVVEDGLPYRPASWHLWRDHRVFVPFGTIQNWVEAGGKKRRRVTSKAQFWNGHLKHFRAMRQSMNSTKALTVCSQRWTIGNTNGCCMKCSIMMRTMVISKRFLSV